jgi:hypothetical protein
MTAPAPAAHTPAVHAPAGHASAASTPAARTSLDEAFERMASAGFELPNGFVNHGAMACEALDALGFEGELGEWAKRFARIAGPAVTPLSGASLDWRESLGDYNAIPEWIGHFETVIADDGWARAVEVWVPRLVPGMATALFHGVIRVSHAVRAIQAGQVAPDVGGVDGAVEVDDVQGAVLAAAAEGARYYLASPNIYFLHGVTGAMAIELLAPHFSGPDQAAALAQLVAEHSAMYAGARPVAVADVRVAGVPRQTLATAAEASRDPHEVKLVEAALRALDLSGDPVFAAACETVTGLSAKGAA